MYGLVFKGSFSAAHQLVGHPGKCSLLHGHRWEVTISLRSPFLNQQHMVVDFHDLKALLEEYDHSGEVIHLTAELLAFRLWERVRDLGACSQAEVECIVEVEESPGCSVYYQGEFSNGS